MYSTSFSSLISGKARLGQNMLSVCIFRYGATGSQKIDILLHQNPVQKCKFLRNWPNTNFGVEKAASGWLILPWLWKKYRNREIKNKKGNKWNKAGGVGGGKEKGLNEIMKNIRLVVPKVLIHCTWCRGVYNKEGSLCGFGNINQSYAQNYL